MKTTHRILAALLVLAMLLTNNGIAALADILLTMPAELQIIDEEAFYGSASIDKVVLSDKVTEIRARAFANSTLTEINLPDSLTFIAEDAFDGSNLSKVTVNENTYAWEWASEHGYLQIPVTSITLTAPETIYYTDKYNANTVMLKVRAKIEPENATNSSLTWTIDQPDVLDFTYNEDDYADEDANPGDELHGEFRYIEPHGIGTATITATADDGSGVQASVTVQVVPKETEPFTYPLVDLKTNEHLQAGTVLEHELANGDIELGWNIITVRLLMQANENHSDIYAFLLDEEPDFNDPTQIDRRVGDFLYQSYTTLRLALQAYTNSSPEHPYGIIIKKENLAQAKYLRLMIGGYATDDATEPGWWTNYAWKIIPEEQPEVSIAGLTYTYPKNNLIVGNEFDLGIDHVAPEGASVTPYAGSENVEVTEEGHVRILDEGTISIKFRDADGEHEFFSEPVKDVFCLYPKPGSTEDSDYIFGTEHPGVTTKAWGSPLNYQGGDTSSVSMLPDFFGDTLIVNAIGLGDWNVSVVDGADWITLKKESGSNTYIPLSTVYSAAENQGAEERTGHIRFTLGKYEYTYEIKQAGTGVPEPVEAESIALDQEDTLVMYVGETRTLHATVLPENTTDKTVTWSSGDESIARVDSQGVVTAVRIGWTNITAETTNGISDSCPVEVVKRPPDTSIEGFRFEENDDGTCTLVEYTGDATDVVIPSVDGIGRTVKYIGSTAFSGKAINSVYIPNSVEEIEGDAFYACNVLTEIRLSESLKTIGTQAFQGCVALNSMDIPASVKEIGPSAFAGCSGLNEVTLHEGLTNIGGFAFAGCASLEEVSIPRTMQAIGEYALAESGIESVQIPDTVLSIGNYAFDGCTKLASVRLPDSVTTMGEGAFNGCSILESAILSQQLTSIGGSAFANCRELSAIIIPDSVKTMGSGVFQNCEKLAEAMLSSQLRIIPSNTFWGCTGLSQIDIPDAVTTIDDSAFMYCKALGSVRFPSALKTIEDNAFNGCSGLSEITLPDGMKSIGDSAFASCTGLVAANLPDSITSIGNSCFAWCKLRSIRWPAGTRTLNEYVFNGCAQLAEITLHDGVTGIEGGAFLGCAALYTVQIPASMRTINDGAFNGSGIVTIVIPEWILTVGQDAFSECTRLASVVFEGSQTSIGASAFRGCTALRQMTLPEGLTEIAETLFESSGLRSITIPDTVTSIGQTAFANTDLLNISLPSSVTSIGATAFFNCASLNYIRIPDSVISIGKNAFTGCKEGMIIYGVRGSAAEEAAAEYDETVRFVAMGDESSSPTDIVYGGINGRVIDENNNPVQFVSAFVYPYDSINWEFSTETDVDGRWSVSNVPTNEPYQIQFYAEGYDFSDSVYQFPATYPSNDVGDIIAVLGGYAPERTLSGKVTIASVGDPLPAVNVSIYDSTNTCVKSTSTDNEGAWMVGGLIENEEYSVQYSVALYSVNAASQTYQAGSYIEAEASLPAESDSTISFTMKQNGTEVTSIQAGTTVDFAVTAPNAAYIRLVADGIPYEEHEVVNGTAVFSRMIASSRGGVRTIQMQAYSADDGWMGISEAKTLNVTSIDKLAAPTLSLTDRIRQGADLDVSWSSVNHAEKYTVYVFGPDSIQYYPSFDQTEEATTTALNFTVPANAFCSAGKYSIQVVAAGVGYDSATGTRAVTVVGSTDEEGLLVNSIQIYAENIDTIDTGEANTDNVLLGAALGDGISNSGTLYAEGDVICMTVGERKHLSEVVKPASALNKDVSWSIIRNGVAALDENEQMLTAVAPGRTKLAVMARDGSGIKSIYDVAVEDSDTISNKIHDAINNTYINNGDTLTLSPNMKVGSEYTLQVEAKGYWTVFCSDESWIWRVTNTGYGNSALKLGLKGLPETNQTLTSTITVRFANGSETTFNVSMNGGKVIYNNSGKVMKYLMKYCDTDGVWHPIQDNETIYLGNNLKAGDKIHFSMDCDQIWKRTVRPVSDGGACISLGMPQSALVSGPYLVFAPQSTFDLTVITPPGKGEKWERELTIKDAADHYVGSFTLCLQYPEPQFYFTSEDNALLSIEDGTIQINPVVNRPVRFHVKAASCIGTIIINPPTSENGSLANWLNISYENLQHGGYAQGASFDLVFQVKQKPGTGQTYSATVRLHGLAGFTGYGYYGDLAYYVDDLFTVKITGE